MGVMTDIKPIKQTEYLKLLTSGWNIFFICFDTWKGLMTTPNEDKYHIDLGKEVLYNWMTITHRYRM